MAKETTYNMLGHYIVNKLAITFNLDSIGKPMGKKELEESRQGLIKGLEETIEHLRKGNIIEEKGINEERLQEIATLAREQSWETLENRESLWKAYAQIAKA